VNGKDRKSSEQVFLTSDVRSEVQPPGTCGRQTPRNWHLVTLHRDWIALVLAACTHSLGHKMTSGNGEMFFLSLLGWL
jgi:hypothetical protein